MLALSDLPRAGSTEYLVRFRLCRRQVRGSSLLVTRHTRFLMPGSDSMSGIVPGLNAAGNGLTWMQ